MKRKKRDKLKRVFAQGFKAGVKGKTSTFCPYINLILRSEWLGGWREGRQDKNLYMYLRL